MLDYFAQNPVLELRRFVAIKLRSSQTEAATKLQRRCDRYKDQKGDSTMRVMRSTWSIRGITASLLLSILPLLVYPVIRDGSNASVNRYEDWLRIQFESASGDIVDRAIEAAKTVNADDPSVFLQAFVEAYNTFAGAGPLTLSNHALLGVFQFRLLRLVGNALVPHWILKSVQNRTILSQERIPSGLKAAILASLPTPAFEGEPMADAGIGLPVFSGLIPINPRAP